MLLQGIFPCQFIWNLSSQLIFEEIACRFLSCSFHKIFWQRFPQTSHFMIQSVRALVGHATL